MINAADVTACLVTRPDNPDPVEDAIAEIYESLAAVGIEHIILWRNGDHMRIDHPDGFYMEGGTLDPATMDVSFPDVAVYGRYEAVARATTSVCYVQDDDCLLAPDSIAALLAAYEPGRVVANMPERFRHSFYEDHSLVGFGAIFDRALPERAFSRFALSSHRNGCIAWGSSAEGIDRGWFDRTCDVVFTGLTERVLVDVPYTDREFGSDPNRMWRQADHLGERSVMLELVRRVRDA